MVQIGSGRRVAAGEGRRRVALQGRMAAYRVVVRLEVGQLPFQVPRIPEQHVVEKFSPYRPDQARYEGVGPGHVRHGLEFVDLQNPQVRPPSVRLEQRIMIGTEMARCAPPRHGGVEHAAHVGASDHTAMHADADEAPRTLVHDHQDPVAPEHDGLAAKEVHAPQRNAEPACCATLRDATVITMTLKARVKAGRLVVDEPTDLPEGTEIELLPLDPGDWLDEGDRAALHKALRDSEEDVKAGRLVDAETVLRELRSR